MAALDKVGLIDQRSPLLGAKLDGIAALSLVDALRLGCVRAVEPYGLGADGLIVGGLSDYLMSLGKDRH